MKTAKCIIDRDYIIGTIDKRIYGSFVEHLGRCVYSGIYEPGHPLADEQGFRMDVIELIKALRVPIVRYPGGNFVSGYNWTDGIGPVERRPRRLELAWFSTETNEIGIDEFADWCKKADTEGMIAVNLGTGTPAQAGNMVEYCNHHFGTEWSDLRRKNGHENPHNFKVWCLGNEMDGPWQIGHMSAEDYGKKACEAAKIMKWIDPSIELVVCGSSKPDMPTFPDWDRTVLEYTYDYADYISLHRYYGNYDNNPGNFIASFMDLNNFIHTVEATADYVKAKKRSNKKLYLSLDEWNVWYRSRGSRKPEGWPIAPSILEEIYNLEDALTVGGLLCTILNHSDRVKIACFAQLVNVIAPILTKRSGEAIKQTIYYPIQQVATFGRGQALMTLITCPTYETMTYGDVPILHSAATYNEEDRSVNIFVLNCDQHEDVEITLDLRSFGNITLIEHVVIDGTDLKAANTFDHPYKVVPRNEKLPGINGNVCSVILPKLSWNMLRFTASIKE